MQIEIARYHSLIEIPFIFFDEFSFARIPRGKDPVVVKRRVRGYCACGYSAVVADHYFVAVLCVIDEKGYRPLAVFTVIGLFRARGKKSRAQRYGKYCAEQQQA